MQETFSLQIDFAHTKTLTIDTMSINIKNLISFPLVFLAIATLLLAGEVKANTAVKRKDLCSGVDYKPLCRSVVKGITDPLTATKVAISYAIIKTKQAYTQSKTMANNDNIKICKEMYDDAITNLEKSLKSLHVKDKGTLNSDLSAAISYFSTCDDSYAESGEDSPFATLNKILEHMVDNCLVLVTQIRWFIVNYKISTIFFAYVYGNL